MAVDTRAQRGDLPAVLLLIACADPLVIAPGDGVDTAFSSAIDSVEQAPGDSSAEPDDSSDGDDESQCDAIYDTDKLPEFALDFGPNDWDALEDDYRSGDKQYHPARFTYDGESFDVQVRLKGNPGFSWFGDKMQFVISFNEVDPDARFRGLRKIALDATWYEPTMFRDRLAWTVLREHTTLPGACANNAVLTIDGELYGVYANIEYFDHEYLERAFGDAAGGTLWKYGSEPTANADAADYDKIEGFWSARNLEQMAEYGDPAQWMRAWAAEAVLGDDDGYWCCAHNFYLYDHPVEGVQFVVWDMDDTFEVTPYDLDPIEGYGRGMFQQSHFREVVESADGRAAYAESVRELNEALKASDPVALLAEWDAQVRPAIEADPHRTFSLEEHDEQLARLVHYLPARIAFLDAWLACESDPLTDADSDGLTACFDNDESSPVALETCDGVDNDANGIIDDAAGCDDCEYHGIDDRHLAYCRTPRTFDEAQAHCATLGGSVAVPEDDAEVYLIFFYTWTVYTPWWLGQDRGATCLTWDPTTFSYGDEPCEDELPSVCRVP